MLDAKINVHWSTKKNNQLRLYTWITCETESDNSVLEERFGFKSMDSEIEPSKERTSLN